MSCVLLTGGTGFIASHTAVELCSAGHEVVLVDNYCNSTPTVVDRLRRIVGRVLVCHELDIRNTEGMCQILRDNGVDAVIHFAALKAVGESCAEPLRYYDNNVGGTIALLTAMARCGVTSLVFSSSATVYGAAASCPITESAPLAATNPYGRSKLIMEEVIRDLCVADDSFKAAILRYFNPVGAHTSGLIGEDPSGIPNNLMPFVCQVAVGRRPHLSVFGSDYPTRDGTGVRDYIHVVDLARAHVRALQALRERRENLTVNLGTGHGVSVLELVRAFEKASGRAIPVEFVARRPGDVSECYADPSLAQQLLGWRAEYDIERMCADAWRWQLANPNGYAP